MRDNRQTARGHLQRTGCYGKQVQRQQACPHQSPAAAEEPQRYSSPPSGARMVGRGASGRGGTGGGRREEKNIRPAAAAQWNRKPGSFLLFNKGKSREGKEYRK